jgi:hypothetical protein
MPMRGELAPPEARRRAAARDTSDLGAVVVLSVVGVLLTLCFSIAAPTVDQIPLLMMQYNVD